MTFTAPAPHVAGRRRSPQPRFDAVSLLTMYVVVLMLVPSRLVINALGGSATPALMIGLAAFALWLTARTRDATAHPGVRPVRIVLGLYVLVALVSYAVAMTRALDPIEIRGADRALLALGGAAGVALCASEGIPSRERLEVLLSRLVIAASACAALAVLQFVGIDLTTHIFLPGLRATQLLGSTTVRAGFHRVAGTARHPIEFGATMAMVLPLAVHLAVQARDRERWWRWGCVGLLALGIPMSLSRTAILGVIVVGVVLIPAWEPARQRIALLVAGAWTVAMWASVPGLIGTIRNLFGNYTSDSSVQARTERYTRLGGYLHGHVIFGRGMGTWVPEKYFVWDNQYIVTVLEIGLVGLAALAMVFVVGIGCARGARRRLADPAGRDLAQALAASGAVVLVVSATFDALSFPMVAGLLFLVVGCSGALWRLSRGPASRSTIAAARQ